MTSDKKNAIRVGRAIRALRKRAGLSIRDAEKATGIDRSHLSRIETGQSEPSISSLVRIAKGLQTTVLTILRKAGYK